MSRMYRHRLISMQRVIQLTAAVLFNGYLVGFQKGRIYTGNSKAICVPVLNCYSCPGALGACPIGALQTILGGRHRRIPFYVLGMLMLFGVLLGRAVCGLLCPFGLVQDLLYQIRRFPYWLWRRLGQADERKRENQGTNSENRRIIWKKLDFYARYFKYAILFVMVILLPAFAISKTGVNPPYFCQYICPAGTLEGGIPGLLMNPGLRAAAGLLWNWKLCILLVIVVASVLIHRPFCRYLCPLGAFYSLFNRFSFFQMKLDQSKCIGCKACERVCPMAVEVTKNINSPECIRCGACKAGCPTKAIETVVERRRRL